MSKCKKTSIGGQALIEGIMMLGPDKSAIAVRKGDGEIDLKVEKIKKMTDKFKILRIPFLRGIFGLVESLKRGFAALEHASSIAMSEIEEEPTKFEKWLEKVFGKRAAEKLAMGIATVLGIAIPIGLFIFLPTILASLLNYMPEVEAFLGEWQIVQNLIEGILRIVIFLIFMFSVSRMKDMKRVFAYHGAEHKSIFCYESGAELTVENVKKFSKEHPRCGTSFMFSVMIISILVFSVANVFINGETIVNWFAQTFALTLGEKLITTLSTVVRVLLRLALLPVVVGISYEVNRFVGRHDNFITKLIRAPGLWFQTFTTFEPDDGMIEVAIAALSEVIPEDENADKW